MAYTFSASATKQHTFRASPIRLVGQPTAAASGCPTKTQIVSKLAHHSLSLILGFVAESGCVLSVQFSREFVQPDVQRGALLRGLLSEHHAHSETGMGVDNLAGKLASAAAVTNAKADVRSSRKRVDGIDVAAARA